MKMKTHHPLRAALCAAALAACLAALAGSCGGKAAPFAGTADTVAFRYAGLLRVWNFGGYRVASIANPWKRGETLHTYILVPSGKPIPKGAPPGTAVEVPLRRAAVFTAPHCGLLDALGKLESVAGIGDSRYIVLPSVRRHAASGGTADLGPSAQPDAERVAAAAPDAVLLSPFAGSGSYGKLADTGIPIIECADYMEHSPLARAEWMRFYGMLFGCGGEADSLFSVVERNYSALKAKAASAPRRPRLMCDLMQGAAWYVPGGRSTIGQAFADAGAEYIFGGNNSAGSVALPFETVFSAALDADVWLLRCGTDDVTYASLRAKREAYSHFRPWKERRVYYCNTTEKPFFDETPFRPDYLLEDLVKILHPEMRGAADRLRYFAPLK